MVTQSQDTALSVQVTVNWLFLGAKILQILGILIVIGNCSQRLKSFMKWNHQCLHRNPVSWRTLTTSSSSGVILFYRSYNFIDVSISYWKCKKIIIPETYLAFSASFPLPTLNLSETCFQACSCGRKVMFLCDPTPQVHGLVQKCDQTLAGLTRLLQELGTKLQNFNSF